MTSLEIEIQCEVERIILPYQGKDPFGHGFLWVQTMLGRKFVAAYLCGASDHTNICDQVKKVAGVDRVWINMD